MKTSKYLWSHYSCCLILIIFCVITISDCYMPDSSPIDQTTSMESWRHPNTFDLVTFSVLFILICIITIKDCHWPDRNPIVQTWHSSPNGIMKKSRHAWFRCTRRLIYLDHLLHYNHQWLPDTIAAQSSKQRIILPVESSTRTDTHELLAVLAV